MLTAAVLVTIALGAVCVWQRRLLWRRPQDRAITTAVMLMPIGLVLIYPEQEHYLGRWLHSLTGIWYLNDYLSLIALMIAVCYLVKFTALRLPNTDTKWMMRQVNRPTVGAAVIMLFLLVTSPVARTSAWSGPIMDLPVGSLWGMWFLYAIAQIWCLLFLLRLLLLVRQSAEDRWPANWFIATALTGIATECIVIAAQYTSSLFIWRWYGTMTAIAFAAIGGMTSWSNQRRDK